MRRRSVVGGGESVGADFVSGRLNRAKTLSPGSFPSTAVLAPTLFRPPSSWQLDNARPSMPTSTLLFRHLAQLVLSALLPSRQHNLQPKLRREPTLATCNVLRE